MAQSAQRQRFNPTAGLTQQCKNADGEENRCSDPVNDFDRYQCRNFLAKKNHRHISNHHSQSCPAHHSKKVGILGCKSNGRDLGFIPHFCEEKRNYGGTKNTPAWCCLIFFIIQLVWNQHPARHGNEGDRQHPAQNIRPQ